MPNNSELSWNFIYYIAYTNIYTRHWQSSKPRKTYLPGVLKAKEKAEIYNSNKAKRFWKNNGTKTCKCQNGWQIFCCMLNK